MKKRYILISIIIISMLFLLTGCTDNKTNTANTKKSNTSSSSKNTSNTTNTSKSNNENVDYKAAAEKQMSKPANGEEIAIIKVKNFGDIKVKFFKDIAPKATENFITHSKNGYYNNLIFHRVIDEFMIQGGDPLGTGTGGESIWEEGFGTELDKTLVPYRGSLCMAMSMMPNSIGSQFFITQAHYSEQMESYMKKSNQFSSGLLEQYKTYGGYLSLYEQYTVFGQVFEGMEVVDAIAKTPTHTTEDGQEDKPVQDVVIETIEITTYEGN